MLALLEPDGGMIEFASFSVPAKCRPHAPIVRINIYTHPPSLALSLSLSPGHRSGSSGVSTARMSLLSSLEGAKKFEAVEHRYDTWVEGARY